MKYYLDRGWKKTHPGATPSAVDDVKKQMWQDYAVLGGEIPKGGPPGLRASQTTGWKDGRFTRQPSEGSRSRLPHDPTGGGRRPWPGGGRWGAIDFSVQSGDVMHFDDRLGLGKPFDDAKAPAKAKVDAENATAKTAFDKAAADKAAADKAAADKAADEGAGGSGSATPTPQRKAILGAVDDPAERQADEMADRAVQG